MTDQVLDILKLVLLVLLYLFFARVLWAVWSEVRAPTAARTSTDLGPQQQSPEVDPAATAVRPGRRATKAPKGRGGNPARLVVLEPKQRRGTTFAITTEVGIGREAGNTIVITDDEYISSHHARVFTAEGSVIVDDLGSRNGTYLNGARLAQPHTVRTGDRIQVGYTVLEAQ